MKSSNPSIVLPSYIYLSTIHITLIAINTYLSLIIISLYSHYIHLIHPSIASNHLYYCSITYSIFIYPLSPALIMIILYSITLIFIITILIINRNS